ncbi:uncharacterized protein ACNS7B_018337 [Menidia menidia]
MAEGEVQYASVVFKGNQRKPQAKREPETIYAEVKVQNEAAVASAGPLAEKEAEKRSHDFQKLAYCFGTICFILLLGIIGICVYLILNSKSEIQFKSVQTALLAENSNLTKVNHNLKSDNENLMLNFTNLKVEMNNLTKVNDKLTSDNEILMKNVTNLNVEMDSLKEAHDVLEKNITNLNTENQLLEAEKKNLKGEIKNMEDARIKFNASRAQWSIDAYCPKKNNIRTCQKCEGGWLNNQDRCYVVHNPEYAERRSWEEARKICRGKGSDLVVVDDEKEKTFVNYKSWGKDGFWIGLKAENGTWKWIDERDLANNSWMTQQPQDGQCVISVEVEGWKSVSCDDKRQWICEKAALSV